MAGLEPGCRGCWLRCEFLRIYLPTGIDLKPPVTLSKLFPSGDVRFLPLPFQCCSYYILNPVEYLPTDVQVEVCLLSVKFNNCFQRPNLDFGVTDLSKVLSPLTSLYLMKKSNRRTRRRVSSSNLGPLVVKTVRGPGLRGRRGALRLPGGGPGTVAAEFPRAPSESPPQPRPPRSHPAPR